MRPQQNTAIWSPWLLFFCLLAAVLLPHVLWFLVGLAAVLSNNYASFQSWSHSAVSRPFYYIAPRMLAVVACTYFARVRSAREFKSAFALGASTSRFLVLATMVGIWLAFFVNAIEPGGLARIRFDLYFGIGSLALLVGPLFEEAVMRGYFYPAFRQAWPLVISIALAFVIDALLFHVRILSIPRALLGVGCVNVIACLFRDYSKSVWPPIVFHLAYNIPFAVLVCMR